MGFDLDMTLVASADDFIEGGAPAAIVDAQTCIRWADHVVIVLPLWLGGLPAKLKGFFEQTFRYGFALGAPDQKLAGLLKGRSARVIVTMGMPGLVFRLLFGAHGLKALTRGVLWISGFAPVRCLVIGGVAKRRDLAACLHKVEALGVDAQALGLRPVRRGSAHRGNSADGHRTNQRHRHAARRSAGANPAAPGVSLTTTAKHCG